MTSRIEPAPTPIRIGISACLLGDEVRFDGGHKRDSFLTDTLGPLVDWLKVCPEVEVGMGTPRETLRLYRDGESVRMLTTRTGIDSNTWRCCLARLVLLPRRGAAQRDV